MKNLIFYTALSVLTLSCAKDNAIDCIQTLGEIEILEQPLMPFDKILVNENIALIVKQGSVFNIKIEAGEHIISDVSYSISDGLLTLTNNNRCNWVRRYLAPKIVVTTPTLTQLQSNTQYDIKSNGILRYPHLKLISENFNSQSLASGDFDLQIENESLKVVSNNISQFFISGRTNSLSVGFYAGTTSFFGADLVSDRIHVFHRSSHNIEVHPIASLTGEIRSTGDLIVVNRPGQMQVQVYYKGQIVVLD